MEKKYFIDVEYRKDSRIPPKTLPFDTEEEMKTKFNELVTCARTDKDIASIFTRQEEIKGLPLNVATIAVIIGHELFRPVMTRSLLSPDQIVRKLSIVALACYGAMQKFPPKEGDNFTDKVIEFAKSELLDKHQIRV